MEWMSVSQKELVDEGLSMERGSVGIGKPGDVSAAAIHMEGIPMKRQGFGGIERKLQEVNR